MACARVSVMALLAALPLSQLSAEITLDGTMGPAGPLAGPDFTVADTLGTTRGANLFHSFSVFNIDSTESATFTGPAGLDNVVGRVTGGTSSSIDGLFRSTVPGADVYFINPFGVIFGQNASLDVQGAFHASTADYLKLQDGGIFHASNPAQTVLSAAPPSAFGFLDSMPGAIALNRSELAVPTGEIFSLIGGDVTITGTDRNGPNATVTATSGQINLMSVASAGEVPIDGATISAEGFARYGKVSVTDSRLQLSGQPGGGVYIRGGEVVIDASHIFSDGSGVDDGGDFKFKGDSVLVRFDEERVSGDPTQPRIRTVTTGSGRGGDIRFEADSVALDGGVRIESVTAGTGRGGDMTVTAERFEALATGIFDSISAGPGRGGDVVVSADSMLVQGTGGARPSGLFTCTFVDGRGGDIIFRTRSLEARNRASMGTATFGSGQGGDFTVDADRVLISSDGAGFTGLYAQAGSGSTSDAIGDAGNLQIRSQSVVLQGQNAVIDASTDSRGRGGAITVEAETVEVRGGANLLANSGGEGAAGTVNIVADRILLSGDGEEDHVTGISASAFGTGDGGNIVISASSLEIRNGFIVTVTLGPGPGGDIHLDVGHLLIDGQGNITPRSDQITNPQGPAGSSLIAATSVRPDSGAAGNVEIAADTVIVRGGGSIGTDTSGAHPGGAILVSADQIVVETDGRIDAVTFGSGRGGTVDLRATDLILRDGGKLTASSIGTGLAGDVFISVSRDFKSAGGIVTSEAVASDGGNITINALHMVDLLNSNITTSVQGAAGAGGNIDIDPQFVIVQNSSIVANAFGGPGGNINITAGLFLIDPSSVISASSALGLDGIINVDSPVADVTSGVTELPANVLDASTLVQAPCAARTAGGTSSLTSAGRSGLPAGPDDYLPSPGIALETSTVSTADSTNVPVPLHNDMNGGSVLLLAMSGLGCS